MATAAGQVWGGPGLRGGEGAPVLPVPRPGFLQWPLLGQVWGRPGCSQSSGPPGFWSHCCESSALQPLNSGPLGSAALVLEFRLGEVLKDHSYKAAPVSYFKHVSALGMRGGRAGTVAAAGSHTTSLSSQHWEGTG